MTPDTDVLADIVGRWQPTTTRPAEFFVAWSGVITLAYEGFSSTLLAIKDELESRVPGLRSENPGSVWPKTVLGALRDHRDLSIEEAFALREVCDELNQDIAREDLTLEVNKLTVVLFACRSFERRLCSIRIPLRGTSRPADDGPPREHLADVKRTIQQFSREDLAGYLPDLVRVGHRESHYRVDHIGAALVWDMDRQPSYLDEFAHRVDSALSGAYCWVAAPGRHMTVRALVA